MHPPNMNLGPDVVRWNGSSDGKFTKRNVYGRVMEGGWENKNCYS